jgi:hypothetical protein
LYPASTGLKMSPGVTVKTIGLVAHVSNAYLMMLDFQESRYLWTPAHYG